ncbi:MAG: hypothetical protein AAF721_32900 [Myxococcota bacterium]
MIDRALLGELSVAARESLHAQLRGDEALRAEYDRAALALRIFEGDAPVAPYEVDLVESWLVADLGGTVADEVESPVDVVRRWLSWRTWLSVTFAAAAAVLVAMLVSVPPGDGQWGQGGYEGIKGSGDATRLAVEALCGREPDVDAEGGNALRSAASAGCDHDDTLTFSYFVDDARGGVLTLFGVDSDGDRMYYAPTPDDTDAIAVKPGDWRAVGVGVHLDVNHAAGPTRVYGLVSPVAPSLATVDAFADALTDAAPAVDGARPWIHRIDPALSRALCPDPRRCHAAELLFEIRGELPVPQESP